MSAPISFQEFLRPGERLDELLINNFKIIQNEDEFCFSIDAILLANFAFIKPGARIVDLGAGTGVIGLIMLWRGAEMVTGIEVSPQLADMAKRTAQINNVADRLKIIEGDVRNIAGFLTGGAADLVVSNPPYRALGGGFINSKANVARARHEIFGTLTDFIRAASYAVKYRGRFSIVYLPERLSELFGAMKEASLEPKRLQMVHPYMGKKPRLVLVEGVLGAKCGLEVLAPFFIYDDDGRYSKEILKYYPKINEHAVKAEGVF